MELEEYEKLLEDTEQLLNRVKALYDQWFQGFERTEPSIPRKQFERSMVILQKNLPRRTAMRFRYQSMVQRYTTLQAYWQRVGRQIEEGTYRRDLMRLREHNKSKNNPKKEKAVEPMLNLEPQWDDLLSDADEAFGAMLGSSASVRPSQRPKAPRTLRDVPGTSKRPPPAAPRPSSAAAGAGPDEKRMQEIYRAYINAKKRNNESVDDLSYERVVRNINKIIPQVQKDKGNKRVDFNIVIKDGRVGLKPVIKDES